MKKGLVLEGGAMRGLFTAGITDEMMKENIVFDGIIGVSAGACFGCNYKSGQIGRAKRYNIKYCKDKRYCSISSLIRTGDLYGAEFCYHELPEKLDIFDSEAFVNDKSEFYIVCTDVETGEPVYHRMDKCDYEELEWMRGSASMPLVSRIVEVGGKKLLDGGVSDSVPLKYFQSLGFEKNIVILTQPKGYRKEANGMLPLLKLSLKKYPALIKAMEKRHTVYNETVDYIFEEEKAGRVLVLYPDEALPVKRISHDAGKLEAVYELGVKCAVKNMDRIKDFLGT